MSEPITLDAFFTGFAESRELFDALRPVVDDAGPNEIRITKSQIAFRRRIAYAWAWVPARYLGRKGLAPLVLSVDLRRRDASRRWKQVVEPVHGRFIHHLELRSPEQLDDELSAWVREAWETAR